MIGIKLLGVHCNVFLICLIKKHILTSIAMLGVHRSTVYSVTQIVDYINSFALNKRKYFIS